MKSGLILLLGAFGLTTGMALAEPANSGAHFTSPAPASMATSQNGGAWLGVLLQSVPAALRAQLGAQLPTAEGILIGHVENNSPAARSGLQPYDIALSYGGQKLTSTAQLMSLVQASQPGSEIEIGILRQAQAQTLRVTLGSRASETPPPPVPMVDYWPRQHAPALPQFRSSPPPQRSASLLQSFESVQISKQQDGRVRLSLEARAGNDIRSLVFEGSRDQVIEKILSEATLAPPQKRALLNALGGRVQPRPPSAWQGMPPQPWFDGVPQNRFGPSWPALPGPYFNAPGYPPQR